MKNNFLGSRKILYLGRAAILLFFFGSRLALADIAADEIRLDIGSGPLAFVKTRDQGTGFGDCYANVAAGLVDAYRFSHGDKAYTFQSSALVLATEYSLDKGRDNTVGGDVCAAFNAASQHGVCNDSTLTLKNGDPPEKYIPSFLEQQKKVAAIFTFRQEMDRIKEKYNSSLAALNADGLGYEKQSVVAPACGTTPKPVLDNAFPKSPLECAARNFTDGIKRSAVAAVVLQVQLMNYTELMREVEHSIGKMFNVLGNAVNGTFTQNIMAKVEAQSITNRLIQSGYNNALLPGVDEIAKQLKQSNATAFLDAFGQHACTGSNRLHPRLPSCKNNGFWLPHRECPGSFTADGLKSENEARIRIEHQIDSILRNPKPLPVGITFCENLLRQGVNYESHILLREGGNGDCALHAALIIGERMNKTKNRKEFLLRNSWGKGCGLSSDWECNPASGDLWISADVLAKNILLTHTLAP